MGLTPAIMGLTPAIVDTSLPLSAVIALLFRLAVGLILASCRGFLPCKKCHCQVTAVAWSDARSAKILMQYSQLHSDQMAVQCAIIICKPPARGKNRRHSIASLRKCRPHAAYRNDVACIISAFSVKITWLLSSRTVESSLRSLLLRLNHWCGPASSNTLELKCLVYCLHKHVKLHILSAVMMSP